MILFTKGKERKIKSKESAQDPLPGVAEQSYAVWRLL